MRTRTQRERIKNRTRTEQEQNENNNKNVKNVKNVKESNTTSENNFPKNADTKNKADAISFYQNNIGGLRPILSEELIYFINEFSDELVIEALKRAIAANKANWGYAKAILKSWRDKNIKTLDQAKAEEVEFKRQREARFNKSSSDEVIPDWFKEKEEHSPVLNPTVENTSEEDLREQYRKMFS